MAPFYRRRNKCYSAHIVCGNKEESKRKPWVPYRQDIIWIDCNPQVGREMRNVHPFLVNLLVEKGYTNIKDLVGHWQSWNVQAKSLFR